MRGMDEWGERIATLAGNSSADENGNMVAEMPAKMLADDWKRNIFVVKLQVLVSEPKAIDQEIKLTPIEEGVLEFVIAEKQSLSASEVSKGMCAYYPSLRHRTHASSMLNSLGKIKMGLSYYFTTPEDVVIESLKRRGEEPDRCSLVMIAGETGMPLAVALEVIEGLLG